MRKSDLVMSIMLLFLIIGLIAYSCAGPQTVKPYEIGKVTAETLLSNAWIMHAKGAISADQFVQVREVYDNLKAAQDIAIDARKAVISYRAAPLASKLKRVPTAEEIAQDKALAELKAKNAMNAVLSLSTQLLGLAQKMGIKEVQ